MSVSSCSTALNWQTTVALWLNYIKSKFPSNNFLVPKINTMHRIKEQKYIIYIVKPHSP